MSTYVRMQMNLKIERSKAFLQLVQLLPISIWFEEQTIQSLSKNLQILQNELEKYAVIKECKFFFKPFCTFLKKSERVSELLQKYKKAKL